MTKKIVCVHLYNDFSGSPLVLSSVIKGFRAAGYEVDLFTCGNREGFLSKLDVRYFNFPYRFFENKYIRLVVFMASQAILLLKLLRYRRQNVLFYINTLLPFGAGLAGKWLGKKVIYHVHEVSVKPPSFKNFLKKIANQTADAAIYVSHTLKEMEALPDVEGAVVYNALSQDFIRAMRPIRNKNGSQFNVLMLCSLKDYKGVREFVRLAETLPLPFFFQLVVNASPQEIKGFFKGNAPDLPNLSIAPTQKNVHPFYEKADLVLNLSHPETWIETFGMTILEAMRYEIPCIVPPVGGPTELVTDGLEGYQIDQRNFDALVKVISKLEQNPALRRQLATNAYQKSLQFSVEQMTEGVLKVIQSKI